MTRDPLALTTRHGRVHRNDYLQITQMESLFTESYNYLLVLSLHPPSIFLSLVAPPPSLIGQTPKNSNDLPSLHLINKSKWITVDFSLLFDPFTHRNSVALHHLRWSVCIESADSWTNDGCSNQCHRTPERVHNAATSKVLWWHKTMQKRQRKLAPPKPLTLWVPYRMSRGEGISRMHNLNVDSTTDSMQWSTAASAGLHSNIWLNVGTLVWLCFSMQFDRLKKKMDSLCWRTNARNVNF